MATRYSTPVRRYRVSADDAGFDDFVATYCELADANRGDPDLLRNLRTLEVGGSLYVGGGAAAKFTVTRIG